MIGPFIVGQPHLCWGWDAIQTAIWAAQGKEMFDGQLRVIAAPFTNADNRILSILGDDVGSVGDRLLVMDHTPSPLELARHRADLLVLEMDADMGAYRSLARKATIIICRSGTRQK